jgi:hypothetical protein
MPKPNWDPFGVRRSHTFTNCLENRDALLFKFSGIWKHFYGSGVRFLDSPHKITPIGVFL